MQLALEILKRTFYAAALLVFVTPDCDCHCECECDCEWMWNSSIESFVLCLPKRLDVYCDAAWGSSVVVVFGVALFWAMVR